MLTISNSLFCEHLKISYGYQLHFIISILYIISYAKTNSKEITDVLMKLNEFVHFTVLIITLSLLRPSGLYFQSQTHQNLIAYVLVQTCLGEKIWHSGVELVQDLGIHHLVHFQ